MVTTISKCISSDIQVCRFPTGFSSSSPAENFDQQNLKQTTLIIILAITTTNKLPRSSSNLCSCTLTPLSTSLHANLPESSRYCSYRLTHQALRRASDAIRGTFQTTGYLSSQAMSVGRDRTGMRTADRVCLENGKRWAFGLGNKWLLCVQLTVRLQWAESVEP